MIWDKEETLPREEIEAIQLAKLKNRTVTRWMQRALSRTMCRHWRT